MSGDGQGVLFGRGHEVVRTDDWKFANSSKNFVFADSSSGTDQPWAWCLYHGQGWVTQNAHFNVCVKMTLNCVRFKRKCSNCFKCLLHDPMQRSAILCDICIQSAFSAHGFFKAAYDPSLIMAKVEGCQGLPGMMVKAPEPSETHLGAC